MEVVKPSNTTHVIEFIPREDPVGNYDLVILNEDTRAETTFNFVSPSLADGLFSDSITHTFLEGDNYQMKVIEDSLVVFRGKIFATEQEPQDYQASKDIFVYE